MYAAPCSAVHMASWPVSKNSEGFLDSHYYTSVPRFAPTYIQQLTIILATLLLYREKVEGHKKGNYKKTTKKKGPMFCGAGIHYLHELGSALKRVIWNSDRDYDYPAGCLCLRTHDWRKIIITMAKGNILKFR